MKTKFGSIVVDGRGKIGGHVVSKNRSGSYIRTKVTPVNPRTSSQTLIRTSFGTFSQLFRTLTAAQVAAWNAAVDLWKTTNIFGDSVKPSGFNLFVRLNQNISIAGAGTISNPPTPVMERLSFGCTAVVDVSENTFTVTIGGAASANAMAVFSATPPLSPSVSYVKNLIRIIDKSAADIPGPVTLHQAYIAKFGRLPIVGEKVVLEVTLIDYITGQRFPAEQIPVTIQA